jgi:hypothetical protein
VKYGEPIPLTPLTQEFVKGNGKEAGYARKLFQEDIHV